MNSTDGGVIAYDGVTADKTYRYYTPTKLANAGVMIDTLGLSTSGTLQANGADAIFSMGQLAEFESGLLAHRKAYYGNDAHSYFAHVFRMVALDCGTRALTREEIPLAKGMILLAESHFI